MAEEDERLKITFIAGSLGKGGAEKQLVYMLRALQNRRAELQILTLTKGGFHEESLAELNLKPCFIGQGNLTRRLPRVLREVRSFQPHFIQAVHFYTSAYAGLTGRLTGITSIGAIRGDLHHDLKNVGQWGRWLLQLPSIFLANSKNARENAIKIGLDPGRVYVLNNVIDLDEFDSRISARVFTPPGRLSAVLVARLYPVKRIERFLKALALARQQVDELTGIIVGDGPEEKRLRAIAYDLGLKPDMADAGVFFLGERDDIPQLLAQSDLFVLTSEREGFPNVILEAMAASLPVISTPAGQARELVKEGINGYLVPFEDTQTLASYMVHLARSPAERRELGLEGRRMVVDEYSFSRLEDSLLDLYRQIAIQDSNQAALSALS